MKTLTTSNQNRFDETYSGDVEVTLVARHGNMGKLEEEAKGKIQQRDRVKVAALLTTAKELAEYEKKQ